MKHIKLFEAFMDSQGMDANSETTIVNVAIESPDHTTLVAAVQAAGLVPTLMGDGPFTLFAPVNEAFEKLPEGSLEALLAPENESTLAKILTYHVVAGILSATSILEAIEDGNGSVTIETVNGESLKASLRGEKVILTDAKGGVACVTATDLLASNGMIHVIDSVLLPVNA